MLRDKVYDTEFDIKYTHDDLIATIPFDTNLPMLIENIELSDSDGNETLVYKGPKLDAPSSEVLYSRGEKSDLDDASSRVPFAKELLKVIGNKERVSNENREYYYDAIGTSEKGREIKEYGREQDFMRTNEALFIKLPE